MIIGIGTDILSSKRLSEMAFLPDDPFLLRAFTENERAQADAHNNRREFLTGRFCAKEAVYKALSTCICEFVPGDIEILDDKNGKPCSKLFGKTKKRFESVFGEEYVIHISLSHEDDFVTAFAVIEKI